MFEPELWMQLVDEHGITGTAMAPTMLNMVLQHPKINEYQLDSLRSIGYGAAAMPVEVLRPAIERFGPIVYSGFGMTELGGNVLTFPKSAHERAVNGDEYLLASCGTPMCLADVKVVDEDMVECPPGVVGEIVIRGEQVLKGYFRNEEGTTKAFDERLVPHRRHGPARRGGLLLHRRPDEGHDHHRRRERVQPRGRGGAVHPPVGVGGRRRRAARPEVGRERHRRRSCCAPGTTATEAEIIATARDRLAGFKKPKRVIFLDELPKTVSGKIIKRELRDRFTE